MGAIIIIMVGVVAIPVIIKGAIEMVDQIEDAIYIGKIQAHKKGWI